MKRINQVILFLIYVITAILLVPDQYKGFPIIALLLLVIYRYFKLKKKPSLSTKNFLISVSFIIIMIVRILCSNDIAFGFRKLESSLSLIAFPIIFYLISGDEKLINKKTTYRLKLIFIFSLLFFLTSTFLYFYLTEPYYTFKSTLRHYTNLVDIRIYYYKIHPIYLSINIGIAIIFIVSLLKKQGRKIKNILLFTLLVFIMFMALLYKKGPILSLIIMGFIFLVKNKISFKQVFIFFLIFLAFLSMLVALPRHNNVNKFAELVNLENLKKDKNSSTAIRIQVYKCAIENIYQSPIFGYGLGGVKTVLDNCYFEKNKNLLVKDYNTHNQFLSILLSSGIIGFLAFVYFLFFILRNSNKKKMMVLFYLTLYFCLNMSTENILEREDGVIIISFLISFHLFCFKKHELNNTKEKI